MPLIVRLPRNPAVLRHTGPYRRALNVLDRKQTAVQRQLRRGGLASYEPSTQATLLGLAEVTPRPAVFLDIGAHLGLYSALIGSIFPEVDVRAFEPTPETAAIARRLATVNGLSLRVEELAVAASPGTAQLFISDKAETSNSMAPGFRESSQTVEVVVTTIDEYCHQHDVQPSFIKIDVETLEAEVLRGGTETFRRTRPAVVCEILPADHHESLDEVLTSMNDLGYVLHRVGATGTWVPTPLAEYRAHVSHEHRDWLLVHRGLPRGLNRSIKRWLSAIAECDADTNVLIPGGTPFPEDWDLPYPRPTFTSRFRRGAAS
jgi:FkbM family methyltransferase